MGVAETSVGRATSLDQDRPRDAASVLCNLPGYGVLDAVDEPYRQSGVSRLGD